jgi:hypothetical protein
MNFIKKTSLAILLATTPMLVFAADINGSYTCKGTNPDGSSYDATAVISNGSDGSYSIKWALGSNKYEGVGVLNKKGDTLGGLFWGLEDKSIGVLVYQMDGNSLQGSWLMKDASKPGSEVCNKSS